jgi:putative membrane protein
MMPPFLVRWIATTLAIGVAAQVLPGIQVDGLWSTVVAALLLGFANVTIRPILLLLTLALTIGTLGLFALVVNGAMLALVARVVKGVHVASFGSAILGAALISLVGSLLNWLLRPHLDVQLRVRHFRSGQ